MLTKANFQIGLATLSACGLKIEEKEEISIWWALLNKVNDKFFCQAVTDVCQEHGNFWPTDNPAAMIITRVREMEREERREIADKKEKQKMLTWEKEKCGPPEGFSLPEMFKGCESEFKQLKEGRKSIVNG